MSLAARLELSIGSLAAAEDLRHDRKRSGNLKIAQINDDDDD